MAVLDLANYLALVVPIKIKTEFRSFIYYLGVSTS